MNDKGKLEKPSELVVGHRYETDYGRTWTLFAVFEGRCDSGLHSCSIPHVHWKKDGSEWDTMVTALKCQDLGTTEEPAKPAEPATPNGCTCKATPCDYLCPSAGATMVVIDETAKFGPEEWKAMEKLLPPAASPALSPKREVPPRCKHGRAKICYDCEYEKSLAALDASMSMRQDVVIVGEYQDNEVSTTARHFVEFLEPGSFQRAGRKPLGLLTEWDLLEDVR